jgi:hypothetical protein
MFWGKREIHGVASVKFFSNYTVVLNKKPDYRFQAGIGLVALGVFGHYFSSTPMLLNSSELIFETSRSAPARVRNRSKRIDVIMMNM